MNNQTQKKEDHPEDGKQYVLIGGPNDPCIANGNTWAESEIKKERGIK